MSFTREIPGARPATLSVVGHRIRIPLSTFGFLLVAVLIGLPDARADSILFKDGRYYEVPRATVDQDKILVKYEHGTVTIPMSLVQEYFILDSGGKFTPRTDEERAKVEQGLVPFDGDWIAEAERDRRVEERREKRRERLEEYKEHMLWRNRYKDQTKNFEFEYTVPPEIAEGYRDLFETFYTHVSKEWRIRRRGPRLKVCLYNNREDFERIGNVPTGVLGYFRFVDPIELNFFYDRRDERMTLDVLFHEASHYMMHLYQERDFTLPPWIDEGLAEYYGASHWDPQTKKLEVGAIQEGRLVRMHDAMDGGEYQDLESLMREPSIDAMQYAWSWALNHMLLEDSKYERKYRKYVQTMARSKSVKREPWPNNPNYQWVVPQTSIALFQKSLGIRDLGAFEKQWYDYIRSMEVQSSRGYYEAGLFCQRWNRPVRATLYFKKALEMGSKNPGVYEQLGSVLTSRKKYDEAIDVLKKGIEIDPLNAHLYMRLGRVHLRQGKQRDLGAELQKLAVEIDPDDNTLLTQARMLDRITQGG